MSQCTIPGCNKRLLARGYCGMHYQRWRVQGSAEASPRTQSLKHLEGVRYHSIVIGPLIAETKGRTMYSYSCECGNTGIVAASYIRKQRPKSCGCQTKALISQSRTTHGKSKTTTFAVWRHMLQRCRLRTRKDWNHYGGRGISVCARWLSFENFLADMGEVPAGLSLDRINNDGDYEPSNCRWATPIQQANNRRGCHYLTAYGRTQTLMEWAREIGVGRDTLGLRVSKGMPLDRILYPGNLRAII